MSNPATFGETNERRLKLLEFAIYNDLVMANTLSSQNRHEDGRDSRDGNHHHQIVDIVVRLFQSGVKTA